MPAHDLIPERRSGEHVDRMLRTPAREIDPIDVPQRVDPPALPRIVAAQDHHRHRLGAEPGEMRLPEIRPALRRVLEPRRRRHDRDTRAGFGEPRKYFAIEAIHRRRELARSGEDQPAARQTAPPVTSTRFPRKRLYMRSKVRRLRLSRSSSESDSQTP